MEPNKESTTIPRISVGTALITSQARIIMVSTIPPKKPESSPSTTPTVIVIAAAAKAIINVVLAPYSILENMSRPIWSVPKTCP